MITGFMQGSETTTAPVLSWPRMLPTRAEPATAFQCIRIPVGDRIIAIPLPPAESWLLPVLEDIEWLLSLPADWDSYGASKVSEESAAFAERVVCELALSGVVSRPRVAASADGNVALCWYSGDLAIEFEVLPSGDVEYVVMRGDEGEQGTTRDIEALMFHASKPSS